MTEIPPQPGSYLLQLALDQPVRLVVGRLGIFDFPAGMYFYAGSARGPGGLRGRLRHHLRPAARPHWHIDYLRAAARVQGGWHAVGAANLECAWAQALARLPGAAVPVLAFGAADCASRCLSHLVAFTAPPEVSEVETVLLAAAGAAGLARF